MSEKPRPDARWIPVMIGLLLAVLALNAGAQSPPDWSTLLKANRPWAALHELRQRPELAQIAAQVAVFAGDEAPACALFGHVEFADGVEYRDAVDVIAERVADHRIVMLNESHFRSAHRAFLSRLLDVLHARGFSVLAAETFGSQAPGRLGNGIVDVDTGFYVADPTFAAALRKAHALGWDFVHYEAMGNKEARESGQASHLAAWIESNPGRKLLVYAGASHISKVPEDGWMASRFIALTGIEPITIAQGATACPDKEQAWPVDSRAPVVAMRDGQPVRGRGNADIVVMHPPAAIAAVEAMNGGLIPICVERVQEDTLLRAFAQGDAASAIPRAQVIVKAGEGGGNLRLAPGRCRMERERVGSREVIGDVDVSALPPGDCLVADRAAIDLPKR
ncbi:hypothetical protein ACYX7E_15630 [Luteimonas sp. RIT-PG2_3]